MPRLDRLITLGLIHPFYRTVRSVRGSVLGFGTSSVAPQASRNTPLPILMYHSISNDPETDVAPYYRTNTSPTVFRQQMQFLACEGYRAIGLSDALDSVTNSETSVLQRSTSAFRPLLLTFDDGFRDFYTHAFPILQEYNFTATVFLPSAFIGTSAKCLSPLRRENGSGVELPITERESRLTFPASFQHAQFLNWSEVRELHRAGITFGSHTVTHPKLIDLDWPEIRSELSNSKSEIEQRLGEPVTTFCYPFAFPQANQSFVNRFCSLLAETGFASCMTTQVGRVQAGDDPFTLKRLPMNNCDDVNLLQAKLEGAYDWMNVPQSCVKRCKSWFAE